MYFQKGNKARVEKLCVCACMCTHVRIKVHIHVQMCGGGGTKGNAERGYIAVPVN